MSNIAHSTLHICAHWILRTTLWGRSHCNSHFANEGRGTERVSHLPKATQLLSGQAATEPLLSSSTAHALKHLVKNQSLHTKEKHRDNPGVLTWSVHSGEDFLCLYSAAGGFCPNLFTDDSKFISQTHLCSCLLDIPTEMPNRPLKLYLSPPNSSSPPSFPSPTPILEPTTWSFP